MGQLSTLATTIVVAATATAMPARAGGFDIPEVGVRRTGMGAVIGRPDDGSALYHNPAGLVLSHGWHLYISAGLSLLDAEFQLQPWPDSNHFLGTTPGPNGYYATVRPTRALGVIPMVAVTGELIPDRLFVGAAVFVGNATGAEFSPDAVTRYHLIDAYIIAPQAVLGAAYRLLPTLSVGATLGAVDVIVHDEQDIYPVIDGYDISKITGTAPRLLLDATGWAPTWSVGVFGEPLPRVTWGAAVVGRADPSVSGPVSITYSGNAAVPYDKDSGTATMNQLLPWTLQGGVNVDVTPQLELGSEARWWYYRELQDQKTTLAGTLIRSFNSIKDDSDSWEVSGGARLHDLSFAPRLDLMAGLQYDKSPSPADTVSLSSPSFTHVAVHSGARYSFGRYRVGVSYVHYWYFVPTITDSITSPPTNIRGSGSNNIITASLEVKL
jgi:long-subunit fatty acid transport protein